MVYQAMKLIGKILVIAIALHLYGDIQPFYRNKGLKRLGAKGITQNKDPRETYICAIITSILFQVIWFEWLRM